MDRYPDSHPAVREHVVKVALPGGELREYMPRDELERVVAERNHYRRVLALISAWRLDSGVRDLDLDRLLARVGEGYDEARATAGVIASVREWARTQPTEQEDQS